MTVKHAQIWANGPLNIPLEFQSLTRHLRHLFWDPQYCPAFSDMDSVRQRGETNLLKKFKSVARLSREQQIKFAVTWSRVVCVAVTQQPWLVQRSEVIVDPDSCSPSWDRVQLALHMLMMNRELHVCDVRVLVKVQENMWEVSGNMTAECTFVPSVSYVIHTTSKSLEWAENHKQPAGPIKHFLYWCIYKTGYGGIPTER